MKTYKNMLKITAITGAILVIFWASSDGNAEVRTVEVRPTIEIQGHKSDTVRVMDSYERLMERYMVMVENVIGNLDKNSDKTVAKLEVIEKKIDKIDGRLARIEKALNIKPTEPAKPVKDNVPAYKKTY